MRDAADPRWHCRIGKVRRKTAEVLVLPWVERRDLCGENLPSRTVLQAALDKRITDVVVIGRKPDGSPHYAGASRDMHRVVGILMEAVCDLSRAKFEQGIAGGVTDSE